MPEPISLEYKGESTVEGDPRHTERKTLDFKVSHGVGDSNMEMGWSGDGVRRR